MDKLYISDGCGEATATLTVEDFMRAKQMLIDNQVGLDYRYEAIKKMKEDLGAYINPRSLGTLPDSNKKENTMFRNSTDSCFDIPAPAYQYSNKCVAKSTQANIDLQVNMPPAQDPTEKARNRLLERAGEASYSKRMEMRKTFNLDDDAAPTTLKDFFARIKDGKFIIPTDEKELSRERWNTDAVVDEIEWRDPARLEDQDGFDAAMKLLNTAYNDVSDEIIVKTPEAGLESLRAFQAKTFH